jgi:bacillithiol system protein YtxJ
LLQHFWNGIGYTTGSKRGVMEFIPLEREEQLQELKQAKGYHVIFKHNTMCPISRSAKSKIEEEADAISGVNAVYVLDLQANRDLSDAIASDFKVEHQSPQLLVIKDGECTYNESSSYISAKATAEAIAG